MIATIFKDIYSQEPNYVPVSVLLERIRTGKSKPTIDLIRAAMGKDKQDALKKRLPAVCFSGKFKGERLDESLIEHSGFMVVDFDELGSEEDVRAFQVELINLAYCYACWLSPRGNGLKMLVRIADGVQHREHFEAIKELFPLMDESTGVQAYRLKGDKKKYLYLVDESGINVSRVCYESYDPDIYINESAEVWTKIKKTEQIEVREAVADQQEVFNRLLTWITNRNDAFVTGERHMFLFKLASACCRFGLDEGTAEGLILNKFYSQSTDFRIDEFKAAIRGGYKASRSRFGSAIFEKEKLMDKTTRAEVEIEGGLPEDIKLADVVYGDDVKHDAMEILLHGYKGVQPLGIPEIDKHYKYKKGELTCLTGIGNYGKSTLKKFIEVCRAVVFGEKFATFAPEDNPPHEYYHDLVEILLGCGCNPFAGNRPQPEVYSAAYDFISQHFFYLQPKESLATPAYIKEKFLQLIIKEGVQNCTIDPWNQLAHDYSGFGGNVAKYLEWLFADYIRFAQTNDVTMIIVTHPRGDLKKDAAGNYLCPDVLDINDGSMWNNKMDNILVYHRPLAQVAPDDPTCEFHAKKIRRQKIVGVKGFETIMYNRATRRFNFLGGDYLEKFLINAGIDFKQQAKAAKRLAA